MALDISFACPDWEERLRRGETPMPDLPLNRARAAKAVSIYNSLRLPDVVGQPRLAEASGEWFRDIVRAAFAAEHPETGAQLVNEIFVLVPKKNSKTTNSAALGLTGLMMIDTPNAEMMIVGPTQSVAERCFNQAVGMIKADKRLKTVFYINANTKTIRRIKTGAVLKVKTFDMNVITGDIPALTIVDEEHVIAAKSFAKRVMTQIRGGMITNPRALMVTITTQSDVEPMGVFKEDLERARKIRDGEITQGVRTLPVLYEFPEAMQLDETRPWQDPKTWWMVLPNLGLSIHEDLLHDLFLAEKEKGSTALRIWASQHLNIQVGMGTHDHRWVGADYWMQNARPEMDLDTILEHADVAVIGADVGGADDLFGLAVIGRHRDTRHWMTWVRAWASPTVLERRKTIASKLEDFEQQGDLIIEADTGRHIMEAVDICDQVRAAGILPAANAIGLDPAGAAALRDELAARDFSLPGDQGPASEVIGISQGWRLHGAVIGMERRLLDQTMGHCDQPLMNWCVANAKTERRGNNIYITKAQAGVAKIDPLIALINAAMLMDLNPQAKSRGISFAPGYEVA